MGVFLASETLTLEAAMRWLPRSRFKSPQSKGRCPQAMTFPHVPGVPAVVPHSPSCCQSPALFSGLPHLRAGIAAGSPGSGCLHGFAKSGAKTERHTALWAVRSPYKVRRTPDLLM